MSQVNVGQTALMRDAGIEVPVICGAMYPCSNPELIAAVSQAGGIGIIQPITITFVHRMELREGIRRIRALTDRPIGFNAIVEKSSQVYLDRMRAWVDVALEEGVRFFVTALGNPDFVVRAAHQVGGVVYHDVTELKWAKRALDGGVDGLICVNNRAGGHAGRKDPRALYDELAPLGKPLVCAGGIGSAEQFREMLDLGYAGCQLGTRFIATTQCQASPQYKDAIVSAHAEDIVLTDKISGVDVAVIRTPWLEKTGIRAGRIARTLLRHPKAKHWVRSYYSMKSVLQLGRAASRGAGYKDYLQAGKSVDSIDAVKSAQDVVDEFRAAL